MWFYNFSVVTSIAASATVLRRPECGAGDPEQRQVQEEAGEDHHCPRCSAVRWSAYVLLYEKLRETEASRRDSRNLLKINLHINILSFIRFHHHPWQRVNWQETFTLQLPSSSPSSCATRTSWPSSSTSWSTRAASTWNTTYSALISSKVTLTYCTA